MHDEIPQPRLNALSVLSLAGLILAIAVHFGTYFGRSVPPAHPLFWGLHVGIFPLFFAFVLRLGRWQRYFKTRLGLQQRRLLWRELRVYFPGWTVRFTVLLFAYVVYNFVTAIGRLPNGSTSTRDLDPEQAIFLVRAFSGHWLVFYALPALFFLFVPPDAAPSNLSEEAATQERANV